MSSNPLKADGASCKSTDSEETPAQARYFASFQSLRRFKILRHVESDVIRAANSPLRDRLAGIAELENYECFAVDGHWHKAAAHDARHEGVKMAVGHFYSLNLRTHTVRHLVAGEGLHEHDMSDQIKNKVHQKKTWRLSLVAKEAQRKLITLMHNILLIFNDLR